MKKFYFVFVLLMCLFIFGCNSTPTNNKDNYNGSENNTQIENKEYVTVTFDSVGGSVVDSVKIEKGSVIPLPNNPTKKGYTFDGWYYADEKWSFKNDVAYLDITLTAKWITNQYTLTLKLNNGDDDIIITQDYDTEIKAESPSKEGFIFDGWSKPIPKLMPAENLTIDAKWIFCNVIYSEIDDDSIMITGLSDRSITNLTILDSYENKKVTIIGGDAFKDCRSLMSITIPDSVTNIGLRAFYGCTSLTNVTIPNSVTSIGDVAFSGCINLTSITIPNSVTSIGSGAFSACRSLSSIAIPNSVTSLGDYVFQECTSLKSITISDNIIKINTKTFDGCSSLNNIVIPDSVISIDSFAFANCSSLEEIIIPNSVTNIGNGAFSSCSSLTNITLPNSITIINSKTFDGCSSLNNIVIPDSVISIDSFAFANCSSLEEIIIPNSVTNIGEGILKACTSLKECSIPFTGASSIISEKSHAYPFGYLFGSISFTGGIVVSQTVRVDRSYHIGYNYCIPESLEKVIITSELKKISNGAFDSCSMLTSIVIPNSVTTIESGAFCKCSSLTDITIPNGVTSIGYVAFCDCSSLKNIIIPDSVTSIGMGAFADCITLEKIVIPRSVAKIEEEAFKGCSSLTIYCESSSKPYAWSGVWNFSNRPVVWGYKGE